MDLDPNNKLVQLTMLMLITSMSIGADTCYDAPGAIEKYLKSTISGDDKETGKISHTQFSAIYTIDAFANLVYCFISGVLIDTYFGRRRAMVIFTSLVSIGQLLIAIFAYLDSINGIFFGRLVYGIAVDSIILCTISYYTQWFDRDQNSWKNYRSFIGISAVYGIEITLNRLWFTVVFKSLGPIYEFIAGKCEHDQDRHDLSSENSTKIGIETPICYNSSHKAIALTFLVPFLISLVPTISSVVVWKIDESCERYRLTRVEELENLRESPKSEELQWKGMTHLISEIFDTVKTLPTAGYLFVLIITIYYSAMFTFVSQSTEFYRINKEVVDLNKVRTYRVFFLQKIL